MYLQNPHALAEHVRLQQEDLLREVQRSRLASQQPWRPTAAHRLLGSAGAALVRAGASLQRFAGQHNLFASDRRGRMTASAGKQAGHNPAPRTIVRCPVPPPAASLLTPLKTRFTHLRFF